MLCQRYAASTPQCQSLLVLVRASSLAAVAPRSALGPIQPPLYISLCLCHACLPLSLPHVPASNRCTVACASDASLTLTRWNARSSRTIACWKWLLGCFLVSHTHTEYLGGMHPLAGAGANTHRPYVTNILPGGRVVLPPTVQLAKYPSSPHMQISRSRIAAQTGRTSQPCTHTHTRTHA